MLLLYFNNLGKQLETFEISPKGSDSAMHWGSPTPPKHPHSDCSFPSLRTARNSIFPAGTDEFDYYTAYYEEAEDSHAHKWTCGIWP